MERADCPRLSIFGFSNGSIGKKTNRALWQYRSTKAGALAMHRSKWFLVCKSVPGERT
jgi:hypothetical protein